jgi:putative endonuclease
MFCTYILYSAILDLYYIGYTADTVELRLAKHLLSKKGFTSKAKDWKIVYTESFPTKNMAMLREKEIKRWRSRIMIEKLVNSIE